ncbi:MAG: TetR/AcrR family transcriptional regulator [Ostreibacterium sp.]
MIRDKFYRPTVIHTRDKILNAAENLIVKKGVYGVNLQDIAEVVNIKVPSIYKHFKNKNEVLVEVSTRFVGLLSMQFNEYPELVFEGALFKSLDDFVEFNLTHPAFVRLALIDFASPQGGMEYITIASGGDFEENIKTGPLSSMHCRIKRILERSINESNAYRQVEYIDFYRLMYSSLLIQLLFPNDNYLINGFTSEQIREIKDSLKDLAIRYLKI